MVGVLRVPTIFYVFAAGWTIGPTTGFVSGAGGCVGGVAAVAGLHTTQIGRVVFEEALDDGGVTVFVNNHTLVPGAIQVLPAGQDLEISVQRSPGSFRGVLVRLEAPRTVNTTAALVPAANTQDAAVCFDPIIGITHTDNSPKSEVSGFLRLDEETRGVFLDITVVLENTANNSSYLYSRFTLNFLHSVDSSNQQTSSPVVSPPSHFPVTPVLTLADASISTAAPSPTIADDDRATGSSRHSSEKSTKSAKDIKRVRGDNDTQKRRMMNGMMMGKKMSMAMKRKRIDDDHDHDKRNIKHGSSVASVLSLIPDNL